MTAVAITLDDREFRGHLGPDPIVFRHGLAGSPLLTFDAVTRLVAELPPGWTKVTDGSVEPSSNGSLRPESAVDALRRLEHGLVTIRLYHLELIAAYRELVDDVIGDIDRLEVSAGAFCSSPHSVVPVHVDHHHNLLLQIAGTKHIEIGRFPDPHRQQLAIDRDLGAPIAGSKVIPPAVLATELGPGDGMYIPAYNFHWTETGDEPSLAVSVAWSTRGTIELARVHQYNRRLRQLHLRPAPVGTRKTIERAKSFTVLALDRARRTRR